MKPENLLAAASFTPGSLQYPDAWVGHLPFAAWVIAEVSPKIFVELGTHSGNSYFSFCQSVIEKGLSTKCYAVDTWQGDDHAGRYGDEIFAKVNAHHQEHYAGFSRLLRTTFDDAANYFSDGSIELLHIDGLHTYEAVRHDFHTWAPKLAPGAVVIFHDTNVRERNFGVWKLWEELQARYPNNLEFVHSHGLGVLQLDNAPLDKRLPWLLPDSPEKQSVKDYFSALGLRQLERYELGELKQHTANLNQAVAERDRQIASLNQTVIERDRQIASLNQTVIEREGQIASLAQGIGERDSQIASLTQGIGERDAQIAGLTQGITEHEALFEKMIRSKSWLITKPFRWLGRVIRGEFGAALDPFKKMQKPNEKVAIEQPDGAQSNAFQFEALRGAVPIKPTHPVAVIIPVYRDVEMTKRCILAAIPSVLSDPNAKLLAINDASPSEGMQEMLEQLALKWPNKFQVLKNEKNLGFVRTVNRGLAHFSEYDVVLLNSDVVVPQGWLGRLVDEAYSAINVGTVTPFSNNATICSFPYFLQENAQPFDLDVNAIDAVFRHDKLPCIQAPTGVGFCMYIRRACLDQIGYLNEEKFGRGYGEENDLCQRALKSGWLNLLSPNMYAFHEGGVSFSSDKQALVDRAMRVIGELHPNYHADVQRFIEADPVKSARVLRYARLLATVPVPKILHVSHSVGGGVKQHIDELAEYYDQRMAHILLTPQGNNGAVRVSLGVTPYADSMVFNMLAEYDSLLGLLKALGISAVHFHHTHGLDQRILRITEDLGVVRIITVHDYYWLCANPTLTDEAGIYPGYYSAQLRNPIYPLPDGMSEAEWQEPLRSFIEGADCVIYPAHATKRIFENVYRPANAVVAPHIEPQLNIKTPVRPFIKKTHYTIGVLGATGREKGADFLEGIARKAKKAGLNFNFKIVGYAYRPLQQVDVTGPYNAQDLSGLIIENDLDVLFFPARWPETYSYTLSYALHSGLPIVAPCIGAFPERLSGRANTLLFNHLDTAEALLSQLKAFVDTIEGGGAMTAQVLGQITYEQDFYDRVYPETVARTLKVVEANSGEWMKQVKAGMCAAVPEGGKASWQEALAHHLWRLRMSPNLRWLSDAIPPRIRRRVRLSLSNRNNDDLARDRKGRK